MWRQAAVALVSLLALSLAFHPADLWWLAWVALVPWMAWHEAQPRKGTVRALLLAWYLHFAYMLMWVGEISWAPVFVIPLLGLPCVALMGVLCDRLVHRAHLPGLAVYPLVIVATEVLRDQFLTLTWSSIGYSQWRWLEGAQLASALRVHGPSFVVLAVNAALARLLLAVLARRHAGAVRGPTLRRGLADLGAAALLVAACHVGGGLAMDALPLEPGPTVVGIQANIPQWEKQRGRRDANWQKHARLYAEAGGERTLDPDLLICAETSFHPVTLPYDTVESLLGRPISAGAPLFWGDPLPRGRGQLAVLGYSKHVPIALGSGSRDEDRSGYDEWNVAGVVRDGRTLVGEYEKRILVPFGEYLPGPDAYPGRDWLRARTLSVGGYVPDVTPGKRPLVVTLETARGSYRFGLTICFEIVFPGMFRELEREGADFIVNISNDGWYRESGELDLVHVATRYRAIETRRSLVRVSNTGISTLVDPAGRYLDTVERAGERKAVEGILVGQVPICRATSLYDRFGDLPALVLFPGGLLGVIAWVLLRRRPSRGPGPSP